MRVALVLGCAVVVGAAVSCRDVLGLGGIREAPCVGSGCDAGDSGGDATLDDGGDDGSDASAPETCSPVQPLNPSSFDSGACVFAQDAGCAPGPIHPSTYHWVPPHVNHKACTAAQVDGFYTSCIGSTGNSTTCAVYSGNPANKACYDCILSVRGDSTYGAIIVQPVAGGGGFPIFNNAGCMAALDPCNLPCAEAVLALGQCEFDTCVPNCSTAPELTACVDQALPCPCGPYNEVAQDCGQAVIAAKSPASRCLPSSGTEKDHFTVIASAICSGQ
jgi:hypothetical protein